MTLQIRSWLPFRSSLTCVTLLAFVTGCEWDSKESSLYAVKDDRGVWTDHSKITASPTAEVATTLTVDQLRQLQQHDAEVRQRQVEAGSDDAMRRSIRLNQEREELKRRLDEQVEEDTRRTALWKEQRQREQEEKQRLNSRFAQRNQADPWQSQQPSQTIDDQLRRIQRQEEAQIQEKMLRHYPGVIGGNP